MKAKYIYIIVILISLYSCIKNDTYYDNLDSDKYLDFQLNDQLLYSGTTQVFADSVVYDSVYIDSFYVDTVSGDTIDMVYLDSVSIDSIYVDSLCTDTFLVSRIDSGYRNYAEYYNYQYSTVEFNCTNSYAVNDTFSLYCENTLFTIKWADFYFYDYFVNTHKTVNYTFNNQTISDVFVLSQSSDSAVTRVYFHPTYGILEYKRNGISFRRQ